MFGSLTSYLKYSLSISKGWLITKSYFGYSFTICECVGEDMGDSLLVYTGQRVFGVKSTSLSLGETFEGLY